MKSIKYSEKDLQTRIIKHFESEGSLAIKNHCGMVYTKEGKGYTLGKVGFPDLTIYSERNNIFLIEVKKTDGFLSEAQIKTHIKLFELGISVFIMSTIGIYDNFLTPLQSPSKATRKYKYIPKKSEHLIEKKLTQKRDLI